MMEYSAPFRSEMVRPRVRGVSPFCGYLPLIHNGPPPKAFFLTQCFRNGTFGSCRVIE
jgi:hypothetical protein